MKYTKLRLSWGTAPEETVTLSLDQLNYTNPFFIKGVSGLEPPARNNYLSTKAEDGMVYQGYRFENREITILVGFQPEYSTGGNVGDLRQQLYGMLTPRQYGSITATLLTPDETDWIKTTCYAKNLEPNIFTKDPELQIVLSCTSSFFEGIPFVHPNPASLSAKTIFDITNVGNASTGFITQVVMNSTQPFFRFFTEDEQRWVHITYPFVAGDIIDINTTIGQRFATLTRGGVKTNLLQYLSPNTTWLQLDRGLNRFKPTPTDYTITSWAHTPRYLGV